MASSPGKPISTHPGPYPRNSAQTAWRLESFRSGVFSYMTKNELFGKLVLNKDSFAQAVQELWKELDVGRYEWQKCHSFTLGRLDQYRAAVRSMSNIGDAFDTNKLVRLIRTYPLCTWYNGSQHTLKLIRDGESMRDIVLTTSYQMGSAQLDTCEAPPLPKGLPSKWKLRRLYRISVTSDTSDAALKAMKGWLHQKGIFESVIELDTGSGPLDMDWNALETETTASRLERLRIEVGDCAQKRYSLWFFFLQDKVQNLEIWSHSAPREQYVDIEDLWIQRRKWSSCFHTLTSLSLSMGMFRCYEGDQLGNAAMRLPDVPIDDRSGIIWSDQDIGATLNKLSLHLYQSPKRSLEKYNDFPRLSTVAQELLRIGGPLCQYTIKIDPHVRGASAVSNFITGILRREINGIVESVRNTRPAGWSRKPRTPLVSQEIRGTNVVNGSGKKTKAEDFSSGNRKVVRRLSF